MLIFIIYNSKLSIFELWTVDKKRHLKASLYGNCDEHFLCTMF